MQQTTLGTNCEVINEKQKELNENCEEFSVDYCFKKIKEEEMLWDLRHWKSDHNREEVIDWLKNMDKKDYDKVFIGHTSLCVKTLIIGHKIEIEKVTDAIMQNNKVKYHDAIGSSFFCQTCGKTFENCSFLVSCSNCEGTTEHNKFNLLNTKLGEHGYCKFESEDQEDICDECDKKSEFGNSDGRYCKEHAKEKGLFNCEKKTNLEMIKKLSGEEIIRIMCLGHPQEHGEPYNRTEIMDECSRRGFSLLKEVNWPSDLEAIYRNKYTADEETVNEILSQFWVEERDGKLEEKTWSLVEHWLPKDKWVDKECFPEHNPKKTLAGWF